MYISQTWKLTNRSQVKFGMFKYPAIKWPSPHWIIEYLYHLGTIHNCQHSIEFTYPLLSIHTPYLTHYVIEGVSWKCSWDSYGYFCICHLHWYSKGRWAHTHRQNIFRTLHLKIYDSAISVDYSENCFLT